LVLTADRRGISQDLSDVWIHLDEGLVLDLGVVVANLLIYKMFELVTDSGEEDIDHELETTEASQNVFEKKSISSAKTKKSKKNKRNF
jgi:hypothetical protein